ncbi:MAG: retropepsin-like aspartic protease [Candidatus Omnitrophota bacterium]|nr:retropepsin-like aspartic protease [Candidatus Omnitrophota bacterium]
MKKNNLLALLILVFAFQGQAQADTVFLKNKRALEGLVKSEDAGSIELEVCYGGTVKFQKSDVEKIERSLPEEAVIIRRKWEKQKIDNQERMRRQSREEEAKPRRIDFSADSHSIILPVTLNKKVEARLVLDTGATLVVLNKGIAEELNLKTGPASPEIKLTLADGRQVNAKFVVLESVKVENSEARDVEAAVMLEDVRDASFGDGLLGMSFLKHFSFNVNYKEKRLTLEKL